MGLVSEVEMGRKRKPLIDKKTTLLLTIDNELLFQLCDLYQIEYNKDDILINSDIKEQITTKIFEKLQDLTK